MSLIRSRDGGQRSGAVNGIFLVAVLLALPLPALFAAESGIIQGVVRSPDVTPVGGVTVELVGSGEVDVTDRDGAFSFTSTPPGTYSLTFTLGDDTLTESDVVVVAGEVTTLEKVVDWNLHFMETITVQTASRRTERIVEAPAAITTLTEREMALEGAPGQLPKMLEFTVGAEVVQNGLYDFNLNTRGFNTPLTRKIQVVVDGRAPTIPFLSAQEWSLLSFLANDLASVELVRGPSAALYGANAFNGILNLVTKPPSLNQGGTFRLTAGELDTAKAELRWATALGDDWYLKLLAEHNESGDFTRSRNEFVEYEGLDLEVIPLPVSGVDNDVGQLTVERLFPGGRTLTLEAGTADGKGPTLLTSTGRSTSTEVERSWARFNFTMPHWNLLGYYNERSSTQVFLNAAFFSFLDDDNYSLELQGNQTFAGGRGRLVGGVSYLEENVDTADPSGAQSLLAAPVGSDSQAVFGQLDYEISDQLKLVLAARWDESTLHDAELSPKGSLVYAVTPLQTLRLSYNEAFDVANYAQLFLQAPAGAPLDLSAVEEQLAPLLGGVPLGLDFIPVLSLGNPHQEVEKIRGLELGYNAILGDHAFLTLDVYRNEIEDFLGDLAVGVNPDFPPYEAPGELPPETAALVEGILNGAVPGLSNDAQGNPVFVLSFTNSGVVDTQGVDLSFTYDVANTWLFSLTWAWFDFDAKEGSGFVPLPNTSENKLSMSVTYNAERLSAALRYRWSDEYRWESGLFAGPVPSYSVVNASGSFGLSEHWALGVNVSNLLDEEHYEVFGGDLIGRRAVGWVAVSW